MADLEVPIVDLVAGTVLGALCSVSVAAAGFTLRYLQVVEEEKPCLARLAEPYEQYLRRVPRFYIVLGAMRLLQGGSE